MPKTNYLPEELDSKSKIKEIILQYIIDANVEEYEYDDDDGECCDDCSYEDADCSDCSCHSDFPGYDEHLAALLVRFIYNNFKVQETPNE